MIVVFDGKRLEPALLKVAGTERFVMRMPAHRVRLRQPPQKVGQLPVLKRPQHEMPVIGHHAIGKDLQWKPLVGFDQEPLKRLVIRVILKQW